MITADEQTSFGRAASTLVGEAPHGRRRRSGDYSADCWARDSPSRTAVPALGNWLRIRSDRCVLRRLRHIACSPHGKRCGSDPRRQAKRSMSEIRTRRVLRLGIGPGRVYFACWKPFHWSFRVTPSPRPVEDSDSAATALALADGVNAAFRTDGVVHVASALALAQGVVAAIAASGDTGRRGGRGHRGIGGAARCEESAASQCEGGSVPTAH
jgi:hypothetical protein